MVGERRDRLRWWPVVSLVPLGFGAWAPIIAGVRCREPRWSVRGAKWFGLVVLAFVLDRGHHPGQARQVSSGLLLLVAWVGGAVASFRIRPDYQNRISVRAAAPTRSHPRPVVGSGWPPRGWVYVIVAGVVAFVIASGVWATLRYGLNQRLGVGARVLLLDAALILAFVVVRRRFELKTSELGFRRPRLVSSLGLAVLGLIVYGTVSFLWARALHLSNNYDPIFASLKDAGAVDLALAGVAAAVSAPVVEEIFFRGLLYGSLRRRLRTTPAALIAGALFGAAHLGSHSLDAIPVLAFFGVIACLLYERTGSLLPGIALHSFIDASGFEQAGWGHTAITPLVFALAALGLLVAGSMPERAELAEPASP